MTVSQADSKITKYLNYNCLPCDFSLLSMVLTLQLNDQ